MNGEDSPRVAESGVFGVLRPQQHWNQRRLPVMTMKNIGNAQDLGSLEHGSREQCKPLGIIGIVSRGSSIQCLAVKIWRIVDEIKAHARVTAARDHGAEPVVIIKGNSNAADDRLRIGKLGLAIAGNIDADLVPGSDQSSRQSANHVGQSTGLGKWHALRSSKSYMHENRPPY